VLAEPREQFAGLSCDVDLYALIALFLAYLGTVERLGACCCGRSLRCTLSWRCVGLELARERRTKAAI